MIRSAVTVSLVEEARGGPFVFWHDLAEACRKAQQLGFDAVEVFPPSPDAVDPARLRMLAQRPRPGPGRRRDRGGLGQAEADADPARRLVAGQGPRVHPRDHRLRRPSSTPRRSSGRCRGGAATASSTPPPWATWPTPWKSLGEHAKQYGVPLIYEPLNRYETNLANTLDVGREAAPVALDEQRRPAGRPVPHEHRGDQPRRRDPVGREAHRPRPFRRLEPAGGRLRPHRLRADRPGPPRDRLRRASPRPRPCRFPTPTRRPSRPSTPSGAISGPAGRRRTFDLD